MRLFLAGIICLAAVAFVSGCRKSEKLSAEHEPKLTQEQANGLQPLRDQEAFELFQKHFVTEGFVEASLGVVVNAGARAASAPFPAKTFAGNGADVTTLVASVRLLYENMDASLRFKPISGAK